MMCKLVRLFRVWRADRALHRWYERYASGSVDDGALFYEAIEVAQLQQAAGEGIV